MGWEFLWVKGAKLKEVKDKVRGFRVVVDVAEEEQLGYVTKNFSKDKHKRGILLLVFGLYRLV
jgi:hypothetical protein